eukprot:TRINITY_DN93416_c0_g1_i1.p1 TRINITY_DN93416_c0_g1~~TRINITY_DN93416_c0_g1_i1.p1  ORF type:complete len:165 (-),score=19.99 TRINITY_DN93416_c0_g1_i1:29-523(-)
MVLDVNATLAQPHDRYIGVTMGQFLSTCWEINSGEMTWMNGSATACVLITLVIFCMHRSSLMQARLSLRRTQYRTIASLPIVFGVSSIIPLFSPSSFMVSAFIQKMYEAYCLYTFGVIMFVLLVYEGTRNSPSVNVEAGLRVPDITEALAEQGPKKHFAKPPLC